MLHMSTLRLRLVGTPPSIRCQPSSTLPCISLPSDRHQLSWPLHLLACGLLHPFGGSGRRVRRYDRLFQADRLWPYRWRSSWLVAFITQPERYGWPGPLGAVWSPSAGFAGSVVVAPAHVPKVWRRWGRHRVSCASLSRLLARFSLISALPSWCWSSQRSRSLSCRFACRAAWMSSACLHIWLVLFTVLARIGGLVLGCWSSQSSRSLSCRLAWRFACLSGWFKSLGRDCAFPGWWLSSAFGGPSFTTRQHPC